MSGNGPMTQLSVREVGATMIGLSNGVSNVVGVVGIALLAGVFGYSFWTRRRR
jgi:hypothetical protein